MNEKIGSVRRKAEGNQDQGQISTPNSALTKIRSGFVSRFEESTLSQRCAGQCCTRCSECSIRGA